MARKRANPCLYESKALKRGPKEGWAHWRNMQEVVVRNEPAIGELLVVRVMTQVVKSNKDDPSTEGKACYQVGLESSTGTRQYVNAGLGGTLFGLEEALWSPRRACHPTQDEGHHGKPSGSSEARNLTRLIAAGRRLLSRW